MLEVNKPVASVSPRILRLWAYADSIGLSVEEWCGQRGTIRFARRELCVNGVNGSPDWMKVSWRGEVLRLV
jgi:hypothetical protein